MVLEVLVHIERVQVFGIEPGEQHVDDDGDVDLVMGNFRVGFAQILVRPLLVFDPLLHILIVEIELGDAVIGAIAGVVVGEDGLKGLLFLFRIDLVVLLLLRQVFGKLLNVLFGFRVLCELGRRGEDAGDVQGLEVRIRLRLLFLHLVEYAEVFDGVIDGRCCEDRIETASARGGIVLGQNGLDDGLLRERLARLRQLVAFRLEVVDVEPQNVAVLNGVSDRVGVKPLLKQIVGRAHGGLRVLDLLQRGVGVEDGRSGEAEELGTGEELFDSAMVLTKLRPVAFIKDEDDAFVFQRCEKFLVGGLAASRPLLVAFAPFIQCEAQFLDGRDDDLVGVIFRKQTSHEGRSVGVFLDAAFLEAVELFPCLAVEILAVHDEDAFLDAVVLLEQRGSLEGGERLAAAGRVPDVSVAAVVVDALHNLLHGIDLIGPHDHQLLFADHEDHVAADGSAEVAFFKESLREGVEVGDLLVVLVRELVYGQESLFGIECKVAGVVVGEIERPVPITDDEELHEAEQRFGVTVAGVVLVLDDLLHGPARTNAEGLQLDLHDRHAVDEQDDIVTVVAVVRVDAKLVDDLEGVFAPVFDVDQGVVQRRTIVAGEGVDAAHGLSRRKDIRRDDFVEQAGEFGIREMDAVERLELLTEVLLKRRSISNIWAKSVFEAVKSL